ncbi:cation:proton antiporter [Desulfosarcina alkanivorans]|uniref:Cation:proton antiporter n=1 Tax=Desulfosarcina alkanivorans TaxID=571177 RepID=A0A5K7YSH9_9BACT|nr:Na+/H+ antiporter subunit D [Desulfosarcina alkanivorans]BBO69214.1 cation:proton antiporter [Desulfosarcina alkanivorans]
MSSGLAAPIILPFAVAAIVLLGRRQPTFQHAASMLAAALHLATGAWLLYTVHHSGIQVLHVAAWPAPFGIALVADHLSSLMVVITGVIYTAVSVYSRADITADHQQRGYYPLLHILVGGISGAFLTGDLFNMYVWFEVMLMASFALLVQGKTRAQLDGGVKYVVINLISTLLFLTGLGLVYGMTGTLNMAHLHVKLRMVSDPGLVAAVAVLFLTAFGIKSGLFPLFFWLPASYHTPPVATSAIFAGLLTKVGVYALIRTFTLIFPFEGNGLRTLVLAAAAATMIVGVLGAATRYQIRRILSFHIISQVGYMILGLGLFTPLALAGAVFYLIHHIIVKANLFLISGLIQRYGGAFELSRVGGLYRSHGWIALLFFIPAFSLAGFPPLSGFWAKMILIRASLEAGQFVLAAVAAVVGLLTVYSMVKIWSEAFWKPHPKTIEDATGTAPPLDAWMLAPVVVMAAMTVLIGLSPELLYQLARAAAEELLEPGAYVYTVIGTMR